MKSFLSYKHKRISRIQLHLGLLGLLVLLLIWLAVYRPAADQAPSSTINFNHQAITTTVFWVGERPDIDNGYIANSSSAWDDNWLLHFGGVDDPSRRQGYFPSGFTPRENPFYVALPYDDLNSDGRRKATATHCPNRNLPGQQAYSWCKNSWVAIRHGNKIAYAQWEDVGPFEEDDSAYVFGAAGPSNQKGEKAGLDVSPAVQQFLGLNEVDKVDWSFVPASLVPVGQWTKVTTRNAGMRI